MSGLLDVLFERTGADRTLETVAAAARHLAERIAPVVGEGSERERWTRLLAWLETEFAWEADPVGMDGAPARLTVHQCPFQDVSSRHPNVCGVFFSTLIESLHPGARLDHAPNEPGEACCAFVVTQRKAG